MKSDNLGKNLSLEDFDDSQAFDQFKGKKSSYREDLYTTKIDESKITKDLQYKAE